MFDTLKYMAVAATLALAPVSASAVTFVQDGETHSIGNGSEFIGDVSAAGGAGEWAVQFDSAVDPLQATVFATIGRINFANFANLMMAWEDLGGTVLSSLTFSRGDNELTTLFAAPNLSQVLRISWTDSFAGANFDVEVAASVPVPAGGLMLVGALGGLAALRRRKSA